MPPNIKVEKKTCVGLRDGQNSFPCVAPFVDAGQTRTGEFWFRSESRQAASWTRLALQRHACQKISFRLLNGKIGFPSSAKPDIRMNGRAIGRASGRERMWTVVEISVAARVLKTKRYLLNTIE